MAKILLVEDDLSVREPLSNYLRTHGYEVFEAGLVSDAMDFLTENFDLAIFDWSLPDGEGLDLIRKCRGDGSRMPIILFTARNEVIDKVTGLELGASDYVTKPFDPRELLARVRALLRASKPEPIGSDEKFSKGPLECAGISMDLTSHRVKWKGDEVELARMEFMLLQLFLENPNKVFTRDELLGKVWGYNSYPSTRTVDNHILRLRQKFEERLFETVRGVGYRFVGDER